MADTLNLKGIKDSGRYFTLLLHKVVPDTSSCRRAAQELYRTNPELVENILFLGETGIMFSATAVLDNQVILN